MKRMAMAVIVLLAGAGALAGCGGDGDSSAGSADTNPADVAFARGMIPHHEQAVEMAELARTRAGSAEVRDLARRIAAAQEPEITQMQGWLEDWGQQGTDGGGMGHDSGHGDDGDGSGTGMMSEADMKSLEDSSGAEFDEMFLSMMIEHHEGAVSMARTELRDGQNDAARQLAREIMKTQRAEISEMQRLLDAA